MGDNEIHIGFRTEDYEAAYAKHKEMGCICFENKEMGIYFIEDPDGYWMEIVPGLLSKISFAIKKKTSGFSRAGCFYFLEKKEDKWREAVLLLRRKVWHDN